MTSRAMPLPVFVLCIVMLLTLCSIQVLSLKCVICSSYNETDCGGHLSEEAIGKYSKNCSEIVGKELSIEYESNNTKTHDNVKLNDTLAIHSGYSDRWHNINSTEFEVCRKIITWINNDVNGKKAGKRIVRKCGFISSEFDQKCYYRNAGSGSRQRVCSCIKDDCNIGITFHKNYAFTAIASFMAIHGVPKVFKL